MASRDLPPRTLQEGDEELLTRSFSSVEDYLLSTHSPETKRKNAALYLRSVSEEINNKKFPAIIKRHREKCDPERQKKFYAWYWRVAIDSIIFLQRLKSATRNHKAKKTTENHDNGNSST